MSSSGPMDPGLWTDSAPRTKNLFAIDQPARASGEGSDAHIEAREPRIVGLPVLVAIEDLLNDHRHFEQREDLVEAHVRDVASAARGIPFDDLIPAEPSRSRRQWRRRRVSTMRNGGRPVREQDADIDQR